MADDAGGVTWDLLAHQKNDSRYVLSRICYLVLAKASAWNLQIEAAACVLMGGGIAVMAWWMARRTLPGRLADGIGFVMALLILSPHQTMNWNFGVQICYFLPVAASVGVAMVFMTRWSLTKQTISGIVLALASTWSFAPGWLTWGLVIWGVLGWFGRIRPGAVWLALAGTAGALAANIAFYFHGYAFQESIPLSQKLMERGGEIGLYFLNMMGAGFAEGWLQPNLAARGKVLTTLSPILSILLAVWIVVLLVLHRRDLLRRTGAAPSWMWIGLGGWALLVVAMVSLARTGVTLSHPFASRYIAFSIWAWMAALILTFMLPASRRRLLLGGTGLFIMLWGWGSGLFTGIKQFHKDAYTMRLLHGSLTMAAVAPEPQGLKGNDPMMHHWLPTLMQLDEMGYIHPRLVRSPLVEDAEIVDGTEVEGELQVLDPGPPLIVSGWAIDHRRKGPADCIVLSLQPDGGEEIWWTPVTSRVLDKANRKLAQARGLEGEHTRISWEYKAGQDATNYAVVSPPARACTVRAYAMDTRTGQFYRLAGEQRLEPTP